MKQLLGPESDIFSFKRMEPLGQTLVLAMDSFKLTLEADYEPLVVVTVLFFVLVFIDFIFDFLVQFSFLIFRAPATLVCLRKHEMATRQSQNVNPV